MSDKPIEWDESTRKGARNIHGERYNSTYHDHHDVVAKNLTPEHEKMLHAYSLSDAKHTTSNQMNERLRERAGVLSGEAKYHKKNKSKIDAHIEKFDSMFRDKENLNKKPVIAHTGIPPYLGNHLREEHAKGNIQHSNAAYQSLSSDPDVAKRFARLSAARNDSKEMHVARVTGEAGSLLSAAQHGGYSENEMIACHGARFTHHGCTDGGIDKTSGKKIVIHHMTFHADRTQLEHYPNK